MRSLYKRQFILTAGMILVSFALLGVAFFTLSYQYTIRQTKESMERNADYVANFTSKSRALGLGVDDDVYITMIATIAQISDAVVLITEADGEMVVSTDGVTVKGYNTLGGRYLPRTVVEQVTQSGGYTGMSTLGEITDALGVLDDQGCPEATILHCNTQYPTPYEDANLTAMVELFEQFGLPVGLSDHTPGWECDVAAAVLGAQVIEKHFTLDKSLPGPDQKASLDPAEFRAMVAAVRHVEAALGDGHKHLTVSEAPNKAVARKSIVAARPIRAGETFTADNLTTKRPGDGISPMRWYEVLGRPAPRDFAEDEKIEL